MPASEYVKRLDKLLAHFDNATGPGAIVRVYRGRDCIYDKAIGRPNLEYDVQWTEKTPIRIASVTKHFAAATLIALEQDSVLSLDDDIATYLPAFKGTGAPISIDHLLSNRSGLWFDEGLAWLTGRESSAPADLDFLYRLVTRGRFRNTEPGCFYQYNDAGFRIAVRIAEQVTAGPFDILSRDRLFEPLGMADTFYAVTDNPVVPGRARTYHQVEDGELKLYHGAMESTGDGAIVTTMNDMSKWAAFLMRGDGQRAKLRDRLIQAPTMPDGLPGYYAYGLNVGVHRGHRWFGHTGALFAYAGIYVFPEDELGIIVLGNRSDLDIGNLVFQLFDALHFESSASDPVASIAFRDGRQTKGNPNLAGCFIEPILGYVVDLTNRAGIVKLDFLGSGGLMRQLRDGTYRSEVGGHSARMRPIDEDHIDIDLEGQRWMTFQRTHERAAVIGDHHDLCGLYVCKDIDALLRIAGEDGGLVVEIGGAPTQCFRPPLMKLSDTLFRAGPIAFRIDHNSDGSIKALLAVTAAARSLIYEKVD